jgi:hypothetical protein
MLEPMRPNEQSGFAAVMPILLVFLISVVGLIAVTVYSSNKVATQTLKGQITVENCRPDDSSCKKSLTSVDGKSYGLTGLDTSAYIGQNVVVSGDVNTGTTRSTIEVKSIQPAPPPSPPAPPPVDSGFNAEQFYNQVQVGMSYEQVVNLAGGQKGACEYSGAPAGAGDYMECSWQDDSTKVGVSFKNEQVTNKVKRSL